MVKTLRQSISYKISKTTLKEKGRVILYLSKPTCSCVYVKVSDQHKSQ